MPRSLERFLLLFFLSTTTILAVLVWKNDLTLQQLRTEPPPATAEPPTPLPAGESTLVATRLDRPSPSPDDLGPPPEIEPRGRQGTAGRGPGRFTENPEALRLMALQQRSELDGRYADLFRILGLSPEKRSALQNLLAEKQNLRRDVAMAARNQGINPRENRDAFEALLQDAQGNWEKDVAALLSPDEYSKYQAYEATASQRALLGQLGTRLSYSGTALTASQQTALMSILPTTSAGETFGPPGVNRVTSSPITPEVLEKAATILTADQLNALTELQAEQAAGAQLREMWRNGGTRPSAGTTR